MNNPVYLEWLDSLAGSSWKKISDFEDIDKRPLHIKSLGFVLFENKEAITITSHIGGEGIKGLSQTCGEMTIPKCAITKRKNIKL